jgi:heavy metal sensor kinase
MSVIVQLPQGGQLLVGRNLGKETGHLRGLLGRIVLFGLLSVIAGVLCAWWLARWIGGPLARLTSGVEAISSKNLDARLNSETRRGGASELLRLAVVFNAMLDRLQAAFQRQVRFTADASHELRTPVSVILSQCEQTLSRPRQESEYRAALETCLRTAQRMKSLVGDLLLLARADAGRLEIPKAPLDLADVVRQSLSLLEPMASEHQVHLTATLQSARLIGDAPRLGQVVMNLVSNALQYNRPDGNVNVSVQQVADSVLMVVSDNGRGIPLGEQSRLGERFYQVDAARTGGAGRGTGLGLSIVSEIVAAHGGTLEIESTPDVGTTVSVRFPSP